MTTAILLSGGMDSSCIAFWKRPNFAITINYGQKPVQGELRAARAIAQSVGIEHVVVDADIARLGSGDMAGMPPSDCAPASEWWPYRNQYLITVAAMKCHALGVAELMIGALRTDAFHVDGSEAFFVAINALLSIQEGSLQVSAPGIGMTAEELVVKSKIPIEVLAWSHSCHVSDFACGFCRGCQKHYETMGKAFDYYY
jgi:7-cyano-7-deazaguanine synthase